MFMFSETSNANGGNTKTDWYCYTGYRKKYRKIYVYEKEKRKTEKKLLKAKLCIYEKKEKMGKKHSK